MWHSHVSKTLAFNLRHQPLSQPLERPAGESWEKGGGPGPINPSLGTGRRSLATGARCVVARGSLPRFGSVWFGSSSCHNSQPNRVTLLYVASASDQWSFIIVTPWAVGGGRFGWVAGVWSLVWRRGARKGRRRSTDWLVRRCRAGQVAWQFWLPANRPPCNFSINTPCEKKTNKIKCSLK